MNSQRPSDARAARKLSMAPTPPVRRLITYTAPNRASSERMGDSYTCVEVLGFHMKGQHNKAILCTLLGNAFDHDGRCGTTQRTTGPVHTIFGTGKLSECTVLLCLERLHHVMYQLII